MDLPFAENFSKPTACGYCIISQLHYNTANSYFYFFIDSELACLSSIPNIGYGKLASSKKLLNGSRRNERATRV